MNLSNMESTMDDLKDRIKELKENQLKFLIGDSTHPLSSSKFKLEGRGAEDMEQDLDDNEYGGEDITTPGGYLKQKNSQYQIEQEEMTPYHQSRLYHISQQELKQDDLLDQIDHTVNRIGTHARDLKQEVKLHAKELRVVGDDIEASTAHITTVNEDLKHVLAVIDDNGSLLVTFLCIVFFLGLAGLFYKMVRKDLEDD